MVHFICPPCSGFAGPMSGLLGGGGGPTRGSNSLAGLLGDIGSNGGNLLGGLLGGLFGGGSGSSGADPLGLLLGGGGKKGKNSG
jgi:hypothetical protein